MKIINETVPNEHEKLFKIMNTHSSSTSSFLTFNNCNMIQDIKLAPHNNIRVKLYLPESKMIFLKPDAPTPMIHDSSLQISAIFSLEE